MKYIKMFEGTIRKKYWTIRIREPYFEISIKKIGASDYYENFKSNELLSQYAYKKKNNKIYITYSPNKNFSKFKWCIYDDFVKKNVEDEGFVYQGEIEVTKQDIKQFKLEKETNKFNI